MAGALSSCRKYFADPINTDDVFPIIKNEKHPGRVEALSELHNPNQQRTQAKPQGGWFFTGIESNQLLVNEPYPHYEYPTYYGAASTFNFPKFNKGIRLSAVWLAAEFDALPDGKKPWGQFGIGYSADYRNYFMVSNFFYLGNNYQEFFPGMELVTQGELIKQDDIIRWGIEKYSEGLWDFTRENLTLGTPKKTIWRVGLESTSIKRVEVLCETQASKPVNFPETNFYPAMEMMDADGNWTELPEGYSKQCNHGIEGQGFNKMKIGGGLTCPPTHTKLW